MPSIHEVLNFTRFRSRMKYHATRVYELKCPFSVNHAASARSTISCWLKNSALASWRLNDFSSQEVSFSRYEILRLFGSADESRNYEQVATSLRRWKGLSIFSDRAFYDHEQRSWVNRDFGVFDNLVIYRREVIQGKAAPSCSRFVWNEVLFRSFQSGYLKQLDWNLYCQLTSPVAKRLYRFLDKRFYHSSRVEIDLLEPGLRKVRLATTYNTAQMKRMLLNGILPV